jgi:antitoxin component of MazEF toxin-antitoxin module
MKISSIQKVIKVGNSLAVTIPAHDAKVVGITVGEDVVMSVEPVITNKKATINQEYDDFVSKYGQTLKNLSKK